MPTLPHRVRHDADPRLPAEAGRQLFSLYPATTRTRHRRSGAFVDERFADDGGVPEIGRGASTASCVRKACGGGTEAVDHLTMQL